MKLKRIALIAALLQLFALTAFAQKVEVDYDKTTNFSKYKTYAWKPGAGTPAQNQLMNNRIIEAIEQQMASKGIVKVDPNDNPDLFVFYHAAVDYETQLNTMSMGWGFGYYGGNATTYVEKIPVGTLLLEMGDPQVKKLVWRAQGKDTLSDKPEKVDKTIQKVVEKMFKKFPPEEK